MDAGTLFQLRNLLNRRNVTNNPASNVAACEDFFLHVVEAHIVSACMTVFGMSTVSDTPISSMFPPGDSLQRREKLLEAINNVIHEPFI